MRKVFISMLTGLTGLMLAGYAAADDGLFRQGYVGVSYYHLEQDDRFFGDDRFETGEGILRLVGRINQYFSSELRLGGTVNDNSDTLRPGLSGIGPDGEFRHNYLFSGFLRLGYRFGVFKPYVALGYTWGEERFEPDQGRTERSDFNDSSMAAGVDIDLGERFGVNIEAVEYYDIGNVTLRGAGGGVYWRF